MINFATMLVMAVLQRLAILLLFLFFLLPARVFAAGEFATSYDVLYDVDESGVTTVTEKVTLKNLTSEYFANQFKLTIGATEISDIKASDPGGVLDVTQEQKDNLTTIGVKFNQQVAGLGKNLPLTITFKSKDFAEKVGKVWEVRIPKVSSSTNLESYNLTLAIPQSFGSPSLINPLPKSQTTSEGKIFLTFEKESLLKSGISANFGTNQLFDFNLTYHLENNNLMPVLTNIALPPDTAYQDVIFSRIDPKPQNVTVDDDGNYLAWYRLNRGQKIDVAVFGSSKLYTSSKVRNPFLEDSLRKKYTQSQIYWEKDNPQIVNKISDLLGDNSSKGTEEKARLLFQFVVDHLKYDSGRLNNSIERLGALTALNNPDSAICMEFTDLFIALARAADIPARELDGFAFTANTTLRPLSLTKDILHAWPEYWDDRRGWVMVDPTWENTTGGMNYFDKLDLNHFVFAIKGLSSVEPVPAGSYKYKYSEQESNDVKVSLSDTDFLGKPQIDVQISSADPVISGFPGRASVRITNTGNSFYPSAPFTLSADKILVLNSTSQKSGPIPAFGSAEFNFNIRTRSLLDSYKDQFTVSIGGQKFTKDVTVKPFLLFRTVPLIIVGIVALMALLYFVVLGGHFYQKRIKHKQSLKFSLRSNFKKKKSS